MARHHRRYREPTLHERHALDLPFNARVATAVVDDPYSTIGEKIEVIRSIRNDPLAGMRSRGTIDQAQCAAGRKWQEYYESAGIGMVIAMDPMKEPVDGCGASRADFSDHQLYAFHKLKEARAALGLGGNSLINDMLGESISVQRAALARGWSTKYCGIRFQECLEELARLWGFA